MRNYKIFEVHEYNPDESFITDADLKATGMAERMMPINGTGPVNYRKLYTWLAHNSGGISHPTVILTTPDRVDLYGQHMRPDQFGRVSVFGLDDGSPVNVLRLVKLHRLSRCLYLDFPCQTAKDYEECGPLCGLGLVSEFSQQPNSSLQSALVQAFKGGAS